MIAQADVTVAFCANIKQLVAQNETLHAEVAFMKREFVQRAKSLDAENANLCAENSEATAERERLASENAQLKAENAALKHKYGALKAKLYQALQRSKPTAEQSREAAPGIDSAGGEAAAAAAAGPGAGDGRYADAAHMQIDALAMFDELGDDVRGERDGGGLEAEQADAAPVCAQKRAAPAPRMPHTEVVRRKVDRAQLPGRACAACEAFYRATGLAAGGAAACGECSRHRSRYEVPETPPHFWDADFADSLTQGPDPL